MYTHYAVRFLYILECSLEQFENLFRHQFFVCMIGNRFCCIAHSLSHLWRQIQTILCLQNISYSTLTGLAIDTDHIRIIISSYICRINRQIWNCPVIRIFFFDPFHTFCNRILMGTGECCKYQSTAVWASLIHFHTGIFFISFTNIRHIRKVKFRIHTLCIHIHSQCYDIHITGTLTISKQSSLNSVCACQKSHLRICHTTASVIVRMKRNNYIFSIFHILTHILNLACIYVRHRMFYGYRQIDDCFLVRCRFPNIQNSITYFKRIFRFGSGKAFRTVFKQEVSFCLIRQFFQKSCTLNSNIQNLFFGFAENLLSLTYRC